jgi:hypothetical protein
MVTEEPTILYKNKSIGVDCSGYILPVYVKMVGVVVAVILVEVIVVPVKSKFNCAVPDGVNAEKLAVNNIGILGVLLYVNCPVV